MISRYRMALMQVVDLCCILLALAVSGMVTIAPDLSVFDDYTGASLFTIFFYLLFFYILDAYSVGMEDFKDTLGRILVACVLGIISSATASFALENWRFDRVTVLLLFALSFVFCLGWRFLYYLNADKLTHPLRVLLVGVDRGGKVRKLLAEGLPKARILGYVGEKDQDPDAGECFGPPFMALEAAKKHGATMIVLLPDAPIDDDIAHDLLEAKLHGAMVVDIRTFYEHVVQRLPLSQITEEWLLQTEGFSLNTRGSLRRLKRAFDLFLSLMLLIPAAPIMLITALLIRLESPGPVIYRQDRVGLYEKEFTVYKFRSMRTDAEKNGAVWAAANAARHHHCQRLKAEFRYAPGHQRGQKIGNLAEQDDVQAVLGRRLGVHTEEIEQNHQIDGAAANTQEAGHQTQHHADHQANQFSCNLLGLDPGLEYRVNQRSQGNHRQAGRLAALASRALGKHLQNLPQLQLGQGFFI